MKYDFKQIEKKWQDTWEEQHIFEAQDNSDKPKFFGLVEFPYPSGSGMHVGHIKAYSGLEVISRKKRMQGYNVLFPIGFDAFGLPTENSAIKTGVHPRELTDRNIAKFSSQLRRVGFSFDWSRVIDTTVIYPTKPREDTLRASKTLLDLIRKYKVDIIAIGNGTASHETEVFTADLIRDNHLTGVSYMVISEAGASVYSASKLAAQEFPDYDVNLRSAVSIARRMQDPLAELVKIDPKAIGVGQYQHDLPQSQLSETLNGVVESCVNAVGVDLNTASAPLLSQVAGINATVAKNIVAYREENGMFTSRAALKKVPKLGPKAFEQCAGFLRVQESKNLLDHTAVHPESYPVAKGLLDVCGITGKDMSGLQEKVDAFGIAALAEKLSVGVPTLTDIIAELQHPGRDPRDELPPPLLRTDILGIESLKEGMELTGTVRNVIDFGAFVDIGVHQDGLVHISQITNRFIKHPLEAVSVGDIVEVQVLTVDVAKKRIGLTMKINKENK